MSWLLFYDWSRWLYFPKAWIYGVSVLMASSCVLGAWGVWIALIQPKQQELIEQLSSKQHEHLIYLKKLELLAQPQPDYQAQYQQLTMNRPLTLSKVNLFNYVSADLQRSSVLLSVWQWHKAPNSHRLTVEVQGEFSAVRSLVQRVMEYSDFVALESMTLARDSVQSNRIDGQFVFDFFVGDEVGE
ncbi:MULTISPECIES: hypothetical protein [Vibrio]|uniref:Uncharacterized protein n=1 Tax=Vibrio halioticoli NBRC 102217 TaxID=1219072 RepID=V5FG31_9VIBR|nr:MULTISPECIES: hypothetical protein [Vibrio]MPW37552.1 hypothetical protein [Vibrio sp. B1Z05]GAD88012.1 hypothetical protein VHA01S_003_00880 [Vibrio halioticoli NBRC 102217]